MSRALSGYLGLLIAVGGTSGLAYGKQFICTAATAYSSAADGQLKTKSSAPKSNPSVFTVDMGTGVLQGDQIVPGGTYTVVYAGTNADGAKLLRSVAAKLEVLFVATNANTPYPFLFTDGVSTITGTCRPST